MPKRQPAEPTQQTINGVTFEVKQHPYYQYRKQWTHTNAAGFIFTFQTGRGLSEWSMRISYQLDARLDPDDPTSDTLYLGRSNQTPGCMVLDTKEDKADYIKQWNAESHLIRMVKEQLQTCQSKEASLRKERRTLGLLADLLSVQPHQGITHLRDETIKSTTDYLPVTSPDWTTPK